MSKTDKATPKKKPTPAAAPKKLPVSKPSTNPFVAMNPLQAGRTASRGPRRG